MQHKQSQDTVAKPHGRRHRCPRCRATFETLRLSRLACPKCGYAWKARLGDNRLGDALTTLSEHSVTAVALLIVVGVLLFAARWLGMAAETSGGVAMAVIIAILLTGTAVAFCVPGIRVLSRLSRPHPSSQSPVDAQLDRLNSEDMARLHRSDPDRPPRQR